MVEILRKEIALVGFAGEVATGLAAVPKRLGLN